MSAPERPLNVQPGFTIRPAVVADAASIAHAHLETWKAQFIPHMRPEHVARKNLDPIPETERWQRCLTNEPGRLTFVAERAGQVVGFTAGGAAQGESYGYEAELYQIYVLPAAQSEGIGHALVGALTLGLISVGFRRMIVWVVTFNPAVAFYRDRLRGVYVAQRPVPEVDNAFQEDGYGWSDLPTLVTRIQTR
ncbi:MAG: GNAT family N-acetyltransferase [Chloroflexi bacterium]|nr:GNAT family N-acetyltransferase [Chloroflexota bacterium]